ncbi:tetratricopeptide repeat protein [Streptomyces aureoverticillatus]|uniref:tetratricopeptide repeat protein n=1 Tax=Streptomyces aureoverticillatus TaxID=66871 RepID=UPI0013DBC0CE|nr:tetratricopeptide repeat protein [Streptomyces aureoverticillatus]QIB42613.1 tetratricopeptide repeat protein [Streptomyces aureoverticillatus]
MTLDRLRATLEALGPPVTPLELAEMLWLAERLSTEVDGPWPRVGGAATPDALRHGGAGDAAHLPARPPGAPDAADAPDDQDPRPTDAPAPDEPAASPLHLPRGAARPGTDADDILVPAPQALRHELAIQRALRPLKRRVPDTRRRVLDEDATAARAASAGAGRRPWVPVLVPATERPLRLALVVDTGPAMNVWRPLAGELRAALQRTGAFRDVRLWYVTDLGSRVGLRSSPGRPAVEPGAALDPTGRQVTLVLSDCSGPHWWAGRAGAALHAWARRGPTALLQPLPERLWRRTAAPATPGRAIASRPGASNAALRFTPHDGRARRPAGALPVPVLELAPEWLADWAALVTATGDRPRDTAVTYVDATPTSRTEPRTAEGDLPIAERVLRFQLAASPTAADLAAHVALSVPALPVMRLIQQRVTPGSRPSDLAEVLLSGLLEPVDGERGLYDFVPGARTALLETLPRPESQAVTDLLTRLGAEIEARAGSTARSFRAVVPVAEGTGTRALGAAGEPFALVSEEALEVLRGRAIRVVERPVVAGPDEGGGIPEWQEVAEALWLATLNAREASAPPELTNVPLPGTGTFVGRAAEFRQLDGELLTPRSHAVDGPRAVVVHGMGGVGKTALARQWAANTVMGTSLSPVWLVTVRSGSDLTAGLADLAKAMTPAPAQATAEQLSEWAVNWLSSHADWVLVLDGVENPADIGAFLSRLGTGGRVLITSRLARGWEGVGRVLHLDVMEPAEAVAFLRARVGTDMQTADASNLAEAVGYLPLALEQAAAYMAREEITPAQYLMALERDLAEASASQAGAGHALRAALRAVDDPLAHRVLNVLAWLAPEPVPRSWLSGMAEEPELARTVRNLTRHSLLLSQDGGTLRIHPVVQGVLHESDEDDPWRSAEALEAARFEATVCLAGALPKDADDPAAWLRWQQLLPHIDELSERVAPGDENEYFATVLAEAAEFVMGQGEPERGIRMLWRAVEGRQRTPGPGYPATLRVTLWLARALRTVGRPREAVDLCESARGSAAMEDPDMVLVWTELADSYAELGEAGRAWGLFLKLRQFANEASAYEYPEWRRSCAAIAGLALTVDEPRAAVELYEATLAGCRRDLGGGHLDTIEVRSHLAAALYAAGSRERAKQEGAAVLNHLSRLYGTSHIRLIDAISEIARVHEDWEDGLPQAIQGYDEALRRSRAVRGESHPETLNLWSRLLAVLLRAGDTERTVERGNDWLSATTDALGPDHPETLRASAHLADAQWSNGAWTDAISRYKQVLNARRVVLGEDDPETWESYDRLAFALQEVGDAEGAVPLRGTVAAARSRVLGEAHPETLAAQERMALAHLGAEGADKAVELLTGVLGVRLRTHGDDFPDELVKTYNYLGYAYLEAGDHARATETYDTALRQCAQHLGDEDPRTIAMIRNLVEAYTAGGEAHMAVGLLEATVETLTQILGSAHRDVIALNDELTRLRHRRGSTDGP